MKKKFNKVQDSGKRQSFDTGSVRDTSEGKGMPHLIAGEVLKRAFFYNKKGIYKNVFLYHLEQLLLNFTTIQQKRNIDIELSIVYDCINSIMEYIQEIENGSYSAVMKRLAIHYENGAKKYDKNNWRKGQPVSRYFDSTMRHLWAEMDGKEDEDHASAILWNLIGIVQTKIDIEKGLLPKKLDDYPFIVEEVFDKK